MEQVIYIAVFAAVYAVMIACYKILTRQDAVRARLHELKEPVQAAEKKLNIRSVLKSKLASLFAVFTNQPFTEKVQAELISAGIPLRSEEFIPICLVCIVGFPLVMFLISSNPWIPIMVAVICVMLPRIFINYKKEHRLQALNLQLGDALVVMANALRSGFGFQQAMDTVRKELPPPISSEFTWTLREMTLGFSQEEALKNMSHRVNSEDLDMVITGIIIQRQVGGNLAEILENISETIRERARIKREIKILTAQGRLSGLIIGLLPVGLIGIMLAINPAYFTVMVTDPRGMTVLVAAFIFEIIGALMIRKIIDIRL
ncbi:MAG: type II secretion system F family protein [Bacillota bacterium]|nr:type II secretion system F family protein [Bacillota bacterium]